MGRGRAKAKQTKVARQLKYNSGGTDLESLRRELIGEDTEDRTDEPTDEYDDLYARYADLAEDDKDEESRR
ncbi:MAG TPA: DUF3073 domain-containing protein [Actinomycetes bacterium]|jgi:hypothetical protein